jgi:DNA polymerase II small subunit/DNA polymerase delta subunit B
MCPGQSDSVWLGEPQSTISKKWAPGLFDMKNLFLVSNPCEIEIDSGFKVLMYHGASINSFVDNTSELRISLAFSVCRVEYLQTQSRAP